MCLLSLYMIEIVNPGARFFPRESSISLSRGLGVSQALIVKFPAII